MKRFSLSLLFILYFIPAAHCQTDPPFQLVNSGKVLEEGPKLHDEAKYKEAIDLYLTVPANDTNYSYILEEMALSYLASGDSIKAIETCKKALALEPENQMSLYQTLGNAYETADSVDKAFETYKKGSAIFPYNNKFYFEMGITYARHHNDTAALRCFSKSVMMNPYHASSHLQLAQLAARNNRFTEALLSYQMFLLLENKSNRSVSALITVENIAGGDYHVNPDSVVKLSTGEDNFTEIEEIIRSKSAQSEKYKTNVKLTYFKIIKTLQALNEKLEYHSSDKNFWMQTYVPFFSALWKNDHFEGMMYYIFSCLNTPEIEKAYSSNSGKVDKMISFVTDYLIEKMPKENLVVNGKEYSAHASYYDNDYVKSIGYYDRQSKLNKGPWLHFYPNGNLKNEGNYNDKGLLDGEWKLYFPDGKLNKIINYSNGKLNGPYETYYPNGQLEEKSHYSNDLLDSRVDFYFSTGVKNGEVDYKNGKKEGTEKVYYKNGRLRRDANNKSDQYSGKYR